MRARRPAHPGRYEQYGNSRGDARIRGREVHDELAAGAGPSDAALSDCDERLSNPGVRPVHMGMHPRDERSVSTTVVRCPPALNMAPLSLITWLSLLAGPCPPALQSALHNNYLGYP